jgi:hypothetical protein
MNDDRMEDLSICEFALAPLAGANTPTHRSRAHRRLLPAASHTKARPVRLRPARGGFRDDSDVDVLVEFEPGHVSGPARRAVSDDRTACRPAHARISKSLLPGSSCAGSARPVFRAVRILESGRRRRLREPRVMHVKRAARARAQSVDRTLSYFEQPVRRRRGGEPIEDLTTAILRASVYGQTDDPISPMRPFVAERGKRAPRRAKDETSDATTLAARATTRRRSSRQPQRRNRRR